MITPGWIAGRIGRGLLAGGIGTAAMTASSMLEMRLRDRPASVTPAKAAEEVLDIEPETKAAEGRLSDAVHWGYGIGWGAARGALDVIGIRGPVASAIHLAAVWGSGMVMLPTLRLTPPVTEWAPEDIAVDGLHHAVYAFTTGVAYDALIAFDRSEGRD